MTMTDPIADMLPIRNANSAQFETVKMPGSKVKEALASILESEGYIAATPWRLEGRPGSVLEITLSTRRTHPDHRGIKRISSPAAHLPRADASRASSVASAWPSCPRATAS